jgi:hypothetical protein
MTTSPIGAYVSEYMRKHYETLGDSQQQAVTALKAIFAFLHAKYPDLRVIEISYNGSGDSGQVEDITFNPTWRLAVEAKVEIDDEEMPDELCFGRTHQGGHWDLERTEWIADKPDANIKLMALLDDFAWDLAYGQNPGFEINEGGFGEIVISGDSDNPEDIQIELAHHERVESTNDYDYSF